MPDPDVSPDPEATINLEVVRPDAADGEATIPVSQEAVSTVCSADRPSPDSREMLFKVVRTLEEIGPVGPDLVGLLDRVADLIEVLRASARKEVAA